MGRPTRVRLLPAIVLILSLVLPTTGVLAAPSFQANNLQTVIVGLNTNAEKSDAVADELSRKLGGQRGFIYSHAFNGFSMTLPAQVIPILQRDPRIAFVELDQMVYTLNVPTGVDRIEGDKYHDVQSGGSPQSYSVPVDVAIIDTGIASHPDLNVVGAIDCTSTNFFGQASCVSRTNSDGNGHGTHVAGTVGGRANGGAVGVAPGARLWSVKVLNANGSGSMSSIIAGIDWVTARANTIKVANMSLGCECNSTALNTALNNSTNAGLVYVAAAGNSAKNASTFSPANHPRVIAVSAMSDFDGKPGGLAGSGCREGDVDDRFASFSNFGNIVDLAAPGVCIYSTWPGGGYNTISGTSMASPHVAGAAALYIAANNVPKTSSRWSVVKNGLLSDNWSVPQSHECGFTGGKSPERSLMLASCSEASGGDNPPANTPPTAAITSPTGGDVQGTVTIQVTASDAEDAVGTLDVEVRIDGGNWQAAAYNSGTYRWNWDTTSVSNGNHTIAARATDSAGLTTNAATVTVNVNNAPLPPPNTPPVVSITSPTGGNVEGTVTIHVTASDAEDADNSLTVQVRIDNGAWQTAVFNSGTYRWNWNTTSVSNGNHTIHARATDSGQLTTNATSVTVNVNNPLPSVTTMHVASLTGSSQSASLFTWRANVTIRMVNSNGANVSGATVQGRWNNGTTVSCVTNTSGQCTVSLTGISIFTSAVRFDVTGATHSSLSYNAGDNVVTSIIVSR